ncbi:5-formyltetrahydrofolate cyclo-ligase [uncultured Ferrimonas sp.]|uniref:5-formyltetrahydrofolate cyclo-ligase n=1 Tax=uncultured Ferrimonas sp. TaxID=432640 RepID=UPI00262D0A85|nr:5-formyltetrahydrofolate cyclo-ligase [uncultured Ferrimonas sp.]
MQQRQQLRQQLRQARRSLSHEQQRAAAINLAAHLPDNSLLQHASHVALYLAADGELDPHLLAEILHARGKTLALPVIHPFHPHQLLFQQYLPGMAMRPNRFGIDEPRLDKSALVPLFELDVVLMPLVGFDLHGNRLGMGGGFYDRTLAGLAATQRPTLIGLAHEVQQVDRLPDKPWDIPLDAIATATMLRQCPRGSNNE